MIEVSAIVRNTMNMAIINKTVQLLTGRICHFNNIGNRNIKKVKRVLQLVLTVEHTVYRKSKRIHKPLELIRKFSKVTK